MTIGIDTTQFAKEGRDATDLTPALEDAIVNARRFPDKQVRACMAAGRELYLATLRVQSATPETLSEMVHRMDQAGRKWRDAVARLDK